MAVPLAQRQQVAGVGIEEGERPALGSARGLQDDAADLVGFDGRRLESLQVGVERADVDVEGGQVVRILPHGLDHQRHDRLHVEMGIADEAVGHEVAAPRAVTVVAVIPDPSGGTADISQHCRSPREQFVVDDGIDPSRADPSDRPEHPTECFRDPTGGHHHDVLRGDDVEEIEDRPILGQDHEEDVLAANLLDSRPEGRIGEDGGALFDELEKQDPLHRPCWLPPIEELAEERQHRAGGEPEPPVGKADGIGVHAEERERLRGGTGDDLPVSGAPKGESIAGPSRGRCSESCRRRQRGESSPPTPPWK